MQLRDYQVEAVEACARAIGRGVDPLLVAPTGSGKTVIAAEIMKRYQDATSKSVFFFAHRTELLEQARATMERFGVRGHALSVFGDHSGQADGLCIFDEAHHAVAESWSTIRQTFRGPKVAITATPDRLDRRRLEEAGFSLAHEISIRDLIAKGHLVKPLAMKMDIVVDPASFEATAPLLAASIVDELARHKRHRTIVFLPDVQSSKWMAEALRGRGLGAAHVDGETPERMRSTIVAAFKAGQYDCLCNVNLLTEGFDCPEIDCVVLLRETQSRALWSQMIGRGLRTAPGKADCLILDPMWVSGMHALTAADAFTTNPEAKASPRKGVSDPLADAESEDRAADDRLLRKLRKAEQAADAKVARAKGLVDLSVAAPMLGLTPPPAEEGDEPAYAWQVRELEGMQLYCKGLTVQQAFYLIRRMKERQGLATLRQVRKLRQFGHRQAHLYSFAQASKALGSDWRLTGRKRAIRFKSA